MNALERLKAAMTPRLAEEGQKEVPDLGHTERATTPRSMYPATVLKDVVTVTSGYSRTWDTAVKSDWDEPLDGEDDAPWLVVDRDGAFTWVSSDDIRVWTEVDL